MRAAALLWTRMATSMWRSGDFPTAPALYPAFRGGLEYAFVVKLSGAFPACGAMTGILVEGLPVPVESSPEIKIPEAHP